MKAILAALIAIMSFSIGYAAMTSLSDEAMGQVYAGNAFATNVYATLTQALSEGQQISSNDLIAIIQSVGDQAGVKLGGIEVQGEEFGGMPVSVNGSSIVAQLPSKIERITIGSIRVGNGASMGSLTIENINVQGSLKVSVH